MIVFIFSALVVFMASALHAATGFGFSILAVPLLLLMHDPMMTVKMNLIISVALSLMLIPEIRSALNKPLLRRLVLSSVVGAPFGLALLLYVDAALFKVGIALVTLAFLALLLRRLSFAATPLRDSVTGALAGGFTAGLGMGGIPLLLYFAGTNAPKAMVRATVLAFFLFIYSLALIMMMSVSSGNDGVWLLSLGLIPVALTGVWLGRRLYARITQQMFKICIYLVLAGNSVFLLGAAWLGSWNP